MSEKILLWTSLPKNSKVLTSDSLSKLKKSQTSANLFTPHRTLPFQKLSTGERLSMCTSGTKNAGIAGLTPQCQVSKPCTKFRTKNRLIFQSSNLLKAQSKDVIIMVVMVECHPRCLIFRQALVFFRKLFFLMKNKRMKNITKSNKNGSVLGNRAIIRGQTCVPGNGRIKR